MGYAEELAKLKAEQEKRNREIEANNAALESQLNSNVAALKESQDKNEAEMLAAQQRQQKDFADIALQYKADYDAAQAEDAALRQQEQKRAAWVGTTEALANLTNLIGVGSFGASNQQYHSYSKDWMDKADADRRLRRNRIDNIRDRQRAMAQQLAQLRGNQAQQYIALRGQNAGQRYNADMQLATTIAGAKDKLAAQKANDAAQLANIAIQQGNADRQIGETRRYHDAQMAKEGFAPDGNGGWKFVGKPGNGNGNGNGNFFSYDATIDGQFVRLDMKDKKTFDQAVSDGREELRRDVAKMLNVESWDNVKSMVTGKDKKGKQSAKAYGELSAIIKELSGSGKIDNNDIVQSFINDHRSELNNFNKHIQRVASGQAYNGVVDINKTVDDEFPTANPADNNGSGIKVDANGFPV